MTMTMAKVTEYSRLYFYATAFVTASIRMSTSTAQKK